MGRVVSRQEGRTGVGEKRLDNKETVQWGWLYGCNDKNWGAKAVLKFRNGRSGICKRSGVQALYLGTDLFEYDWEVD